MEIVVEDQGVNNVVSIPLNSAVAGKLSIRGNNNTIRIKGGVRGSLNINVGDDSTVDIGHRCVFASTTIYTASGAEIQIGSEVSMNARVQILAHEKGAIRIGDACLFASDIDVSVSDIHSIFDMETGERINLPQDVSVGNHVWVGNRVSIMKGAVIGAGTMIGAASIVKGEIPNNCIAAGQPAKVIRTGIVWDRRLLEELPPDAPALGFVPK